MKTIQEQQEFNGRKSLGFGMPKGAGKTTFYLTMPLPILDFQFDLGSATAPPGVDANQIYVQDYCDNEAVDLSSQSLKRKRELGDRLAKDLVALLESFKSSKDIVRLSDNTTCPKPKSILLDGGTRLDEILIDLLCAINAVSDPTDMPSKSGNVGGGTLRFYNDRLNRLRKLFAMVISLPVNVSMTTWVDIKNKTDNQGNVISRTITPDLGGKLNIIGPGMFDSCLYHFYEGGKYCVRTKPTPESEVLGIRNAYNLAPVIDVTILKDDKRPLPYERVFGKTL
jgi:hypothetical protein